LVLQQLPIKRTTRIILKALLRKAFKIILGSGLSAKRCNYAELLTNPQHTATFEPMDHHNSDINFRVAQFIDIDPLMVLVHEFYEFEQITINDDVSKAFTALLSDEQLGVIWLICDRDRPIGYIALTFFFSMEYHGRCGLVDELYICSEYRGQGIGKQVFKMLENYCEQFHLKSLSLVVDFWNEQAEALYTKLGFRREQRHLMVKHLCQN
jgi:GNAT superfamily N-acetyltransferase